MNYRHAFHAGNFADVHKHIVLRMLLEHLHKKPTPFFVLDTHAGRGSYDLLSTEATRGGEWHDGIARLRSAQSVLPSIRKYIESIGSTDKTYSGSPLQIVSLLRDTDRAVFVEKHPEEASELKLSLGRRKRVSVLSDDGYIALRAQLPPKENRGLVLIDPPYESDTEFQDLTTALRGAIERWPNGIYCIWFPLKAGGSEQKMYRTLQSAGIKKMLLANLLVRPIDSPNGLNGSGLLIVNPPWQLDEQLRDVLKELQRILAVDNRGSFQLEWLAGE